jgi:hypothetical protein
MGELLDAVLEVDRDLARRITQGRRSKRLLRQYHDYRRLTSRILNSYLVTLDEYLASVSQSLDSESDPAGWVIDVHGLVEARQPEAPQLVLLSSTKLAHLEGEVRRTRAEWLQAMGGLNGSIDDAPHLQGPDGYYGIRQAGQVRKLAFQRYRVALKRYHDAMTCSVPSASADTDTASPDSIS